ncbi:redox-sensitive bicupin YhaK (pirin superfamily) [Dyadobacter sp. BE34]|uniref:Redox-sensitive bicupin YhaK (Pirin superfamily) n=1 Tax=Dyadobacter fermentans TaxID=94254 RepID=A0ABU1QTI6_9BACT|nr:MULTISPECIES: pirin-like C-terminal cupin domain-containing protein [Dyadobacter]MDR6804478.1 redox-sensitive bicupin YhaK (pirin superfamily) [Dyadobacter fermentans]MDR7042218.1 redox-sensitive bicupin YhaK (pirin superfamily) [Dyadobacter sp. BE242]MDR7196620.1 redox-sensitive bicupin YhaK (pirin superfamily) [Dyadobacter sp. BE34]MDR7212834.1 redox-sensitive bicupin YhaK (pirin superfamily) [Dyadobacter sp. BE31]MDR7262027.1 redox-sensitive bicupin YhaK (pirin superfamily) [Dyadobacter 
MENQGIVRNIMSIKTPPAQPGFLGPDHTARAVVCHEFEHSDPFIVLMDDFLDKKDDEPVGGPHPHAGFETVSLLLEGEIGDETHTMKQGDFQIMTAGSGIVHTETIEGRSRMRLLQMWLNLPRANRWATPRVQDLTFANAPAADRNGVKTVLYSGSFAGLRSPVKNYVPLIVADIRLQPGASLAESLPASYNAFLYVIAGNVAIGDEAKDLKTNQIGWLSRGAAGESSELIVAAGTEGARVVLYAGEPQNDSIVSHGPFIADHQEEIKDLYSDFRHGKMRHVSTLSDGQRFNY